MPKMDLSINEWKILRHFIRNRNKPLSGQHLKNQFWSRRMTSGRLLEEMEQKGLLVRSDTPHGKVKLHFSEEKTPLLAHTFWATPVGLSAAEWGDYEYDVVRDPDTNKVIRIIARLPVAAS